MINLDPSIKSAGRKEVGVKLAKEKQTKQEQKQKEMEKKRVEKLNEQLKKKQEKTAKAKARAAKIAKKAEKATVETEQKVLKAKEQSSGKNAYGFLVAGCDPAHIGTPYRGYLYNIM